jgi:DNA polymerase III subunit chi
VTQVDFYILQSASENERLRLACRVAEKAVREQWRVLLYSASQHEATKLDELLWTFSQGSFVPHRVISASRPEAVPEPVMIGFGDIAYQTEWRLVINLADEVPDFFERCERIAEIVDSDPTRREQGRARYRSYRDRGYDPKTHTM